ncbi:MAG: adenine deaminase [Candidatus Micrarchaeota archaeon]
MKFAGHIVDVFEGKVHPGEIEFGKTVLSVRKTGSAPGRCILPGLVDAHVHTESSMLVPSEFARIAMGHGTVGVVADPHEIANVLGLRGVEFMMRDAARSPMKFFFGASSCVPATGFETAGAKLGPREIGRLLRRKNVTHLSEVMNYPAVIAREKEVMAKIALAKKYGKRIDGHAPGLRGRMLDKYLSAGIETDHECFRVEEAREKMEKGMRILVREGSAAKNLKALHPLLKNRNMLCSDDTHPDDLLDGHLDAILRKCVALGVEPIDAVRCCSRNTAEHYRLPVGLLRRGDPADFVVVDDLKRFNVLQTWIGGRMVFGGRPPERKKPLAPINNFKAAPITADDIRPPFSGRFPVIGAIDGEIVTEKLFHEGKAPDLRHDILKIVVINRYRTAKPAVGFIKGFGLRRGAIGSSVMHDSHNVGVVGADDESICRAANRITSMKGGLAVYDGKMDSLALPYAGLMSGERGEAVAKKYGLLTKKAKRMGCRLHAPFMTLSFMGLLVIPHLKISDKGVFDADRFKFVG